MPLSDAITAITDQINVIGFDNFSSTEVAKFQSLFLQLIEVCNASRQANTRAIAALRNARAVILARLESEDLNSLSNVSANRNLIQLLANVNSAIDNSSVLTPIVHLVDASLISIDASLSNNFSVSFDSGIFSRMLNSPSNPLGDGQILSFRVRTSAANQTLALNTGTGGFRFSDSARGDLFAISTNSNKTDYFSAKYNAIDNKWDVQALMKGF